MLISDLKEVLNKIELAHGNLEVVIYVEKEDELCEIDGESVFIFDQENDSYVVLDPTDKSILQVGEELPLDFKELRSFMRRGN